MFYLKDIFLRGAYFFFSIFVSLFFCFLYKNILLTVLSCSLINLCCLDCFSKKFIYSHPIELIKFQVLSSFLILFFINLPYCFWLILDFLKSSFGLKEYGRVRTVGVSFFFCFIAFNVFSFFELFPNIWFFFQNINVFDDNSISLLTFFFELRIQDFFLFFFDFFFLINLFVLLICLLFLVVYFFGLCVLIYWKKLFVLVNLMFATFLSPPDVYSQIMLFLILTVFLELVVFFLLFVSKYKINMVTY